MLTNLRVKFDAYKWPVFFGILFILFWSGISVLFYMLTPQKNASKLGAGALVFFLGMFTFSLFCVCRAWCRGNIPTIRNTEEAVFLFEAADTAERAARGGSSSSGVECDCPEHASHKARKKTARPSSKKNTVVVAPVQRSRKCKKAKSTRLKFAGSSVQTYGSMVNVSVNGVRRKVNATTIQIDESAESVADASLKCSGDEQRYALLEGKETNPVMSPVPILKNSSRQKRQSGEGKKVQFNEPSDA